MPLCASYLVCAIAAATSAPPLVDHARPDLAADGAADGVAGTRRHAIYVEALGKGGLWGVGYDYLATRHLAIGATGSIAMFGGERIVTVAPYLGIYPLPRPRHRWFIHAGAEVANLSRPSPVPEWPGTSSTGVGASVATGYELRTRVLIRAYAMVTVGAGGVAPWLGVSLGTTL